MLIEFLGEEPSLNVFFNFFQAKDVWKGTWCSFNVVLGRMLFAFFQNNDNRFKNQFFKVRFAESERPFYSENDVEATGVERFPLCWRFDMRQILDLE